MKDKPKCAQCGVALGPKQTMNLCQPEIFCSKKCAEAWRDAHYPEKRRNIGIEIKPEFDEPGECPECGREIGEDFDVGDIYIDTSTGFVTLKKDCECGKKLALFYDYDRTELREE